jgi:hypothetical protein
MTVQQTRTCEKCGGTITAEEIIQRRAGLVDKKLLCVACVDALRRQVAMARAAAAQKARDAEEQAARQQPEAETAAPETREQEETAAREAAAAAGEPEGSQAPQAEEEYTEAAAEEPEPAEKSTAPVEGMRRCLIFHSAPTPEGIADLQQRINQWLSANPDVVVRSTSTTVGPCNGTPGESRFFVTMFF